MQPSMESECAKTLRPRHGYIVWWITLHFLLVMVSFDEAWNVMIIDYLNPVMQRYAIMVPFLKFQIGFYMLKRMAHQNDLASKIFFSFPSYLLNHKTVSVLIDIYWVPIIYIYQEQSKVWRHTDK